MLPTTVIFPISPDNSPKVASLSAFLAALIALTPFAKPLTTGTTPSPLSHHASFCPVIKSFPVYASAKPFGSPVIGIILRIKEVAIP